ncbi:MAG: YigZ family protein, partial [Candidatus Zixiibacteriota bacterium]
RDGRAEIKVKGSRFIGEAMPVADVSEAQERLHAIRKREHAATHHCYAWRIGLFEQQRLKFSDDGEPGGTAGKPILEVIEGAGVTNTLIVVTRYFGGTKLGTGGLVRAYTEAAQKALEAADVTQSFLTKTFRLRMDFSQYEPVQRVIHKLGATITSSDFADAVTLHVAVRLSRAEELQKQLTETTAGKVVCETIESETAD